MSDFQIADHGSIISIKPVSEAARIWVDENVVSEPWQWVQGALCVEARFAREIRVLAQVERGRLGHLAVMDLAAGKFPQPGH